MYFLCNISYKAAEFDLAERGKKTSLQVMHSQYYIYWFCLLGANVNDRYEIEGMEMPYR